MKRKILILPSWYPEDAHPVSGVFVQDQAIVLAGVYEVSVLVPKVIGWREAAKGNGKPKSQVEIRAGLQVFREIALLTVPGPFTALYYPWHLLKYGLEVYDRRMVFFDSYCRAAIRGLNKVLATWGKPDMIHAHVVLPAGWAAVELGKKYNIPIVLTEHSSPFSAHLSSAYQERLVANVLTRVDHIIAVSPFMAQQIYSFQKEPKLTVAGNLVRTDFFSLPVELGNTSRKGIAFLSIGLLTKQKGIIYLLEAAHILLKRGYKSFVLVIGGDGPERTKLERAAQRLGLAHKCRFVGLLNREAVRDWIQKCDVFVLPSLHETFGIVLGEALACGKPVISTRCGGTEFVVTPETGVLVNVADPVDLADAMEGFTAGKYRFDPAMMRKSVTDRFGEDSFLRNISKIYKRVWSKE